MNKLYLHAWNKAQAPKKPEGSESKISHYIMTVDLKFYA